MDQLVSLARQVKLGHLVHQEFLVKKADLVMLGKRVHLDRWVPQERLVLSVLLVCLDSQENVVSQEFLAQQVSRVNQDRQVQLVLRETRVHRDWQAMLGPKDQKEKLVLVDHGDPLERKERAVTQDLLVQLAETASQASEVCPDLLDPWESQERMETRVKLVPQERKGSREEKEHRVHLVRKDCKGYEVPQDPLELLVNVAHQV